MGKKSTDPTNRIGINAVEAIFLKEFKWIFREQHVSDFGIDAQVEAVVDGKQTGRLFALQIKTGPSYFKRKGDGYVYYGDNKHLEYWLDHSLPVFIVIHDPSRNLTLWQRVDRERCRPTETGWAIDIPETQVLEKSQRV